MLNTSEINVIHMHELPSLHVKLKTVPHQHPTQVLEVCLCIGTDACQLSPARSMTVAALDQTDTQWTSSNYGSRVDLYAPGASVLSAMNTRGATAMTASGINMGCPHVSGMAVMSTRSGSHNKSYCKHLIDLLI